MVLTTEKTVRMNSRLFPHQKEFVKALAKKMGKGEGEIFREITQFYIDKNKKK